MARGQGESSEFVTKRMCCSFLFSIGFLCLLCGFLLGRFATEKTIETRAQEKRYQLAGNGLESTVYIQHFLIHELEKTQFNVNLPKGSVEGDFSSIIGVFSNLSLFHEIYQHETYIAAFAKGSRESDRYVVLSMSERIGGIALELARILTDVKTEYDWKPRRSLVFCIFSGTRDSCSEILSPFIERKVVAYIAVHGSEWPSLGCFRISGSDIIQSIASDAASTVRNFNTQEGAKSTWIRKNNSRLALTTPHVVFSVAEEDITRDSNGRNKTLCKINLTQTLSQTIWRLSESLVIKWDVSYFNKTIFSTIEPLNNTEFGSIKERIEQVVTELLISVEAWNRRIDATESTKALEIRMLNDLSMELDRLLLCYDKESKPSINWTAIFTLPQSPPGTFIHLTRILKCYENAVQLLNGWMKI